MLDDFTTIELARDAYGVVFADERTLEIDAAATEKLRGELPRRQNGSSLTAVLREARAAAVLVAASLAGNRELGTLSRSSAIAAPSDGANAHAASQSRPATR